MCEQFNENKDDNNEKCHFANDHYIPRADVVPKSEVEKIFAEIELEIKLALDSNYKARIQVELSDELYHTVNGKISALRGIDDFLAELKKKYTEVQE